MYWGTEGNKPPSDIPACGFKNELCPEDKTGKWTFGCIRITLQNFRNLNDLKDRQSWFRSWAFILHYSLTIVATITHYIET